MAVRTCSLEGEIDIDNVAIIHRELELTLAADAHLIVDCARLTFIDAAGLHALHDARSALGERGRTMSVVRLQRGPRRVLDAVGLITVFGVPDEMHAPALASSAIEQRDLADRERLCARRERDLAAHDGMAKHMHRRAADLHSTAAEIHDRVAALLADLEWRSPAAPPRDRTSPSLSTPATH